MRPSVGFNARCAIPVFTFAEVKSNIAYIREALGFDYTVPVVSEPVPAVVGIAMSGDNGFFTGSPLPNGALTKSRNSASG